MSVAEVGGWGERFEFPFFGGSVSTEASLSSVYDATLNGVPFMLDLKNYKLSHRSVPIQRAAFDQRDSPGRGTLNPEGFWGRTMESWHVGAGQTHFDRANESDPFRFRRSRGVNVWDRYQTSLLNALDDKLITSSNVRLVVAGDYLYIITATSIRYTQDITPGSPSWSDITGEPGTAPTVIASDGFNVLTVHGASGIYKTTRGAATTASQITGTVDNVAYGKGRWIAAAGPALYDITTLVPGAAAPLPTALFTHPNSDFDWMGFAEGPSAFYAGGLSGDKSLIYRLTMKEDGTGLNQPVVAGFLPDGELLFSMQGYLGFVLIGTSKGVRVGVPGGNGDLTIGALIETDEAVRCFEGQDRFVWFGWSNFEGTHYGLGRIDLSVFSDTQALAPAYAADLMVEGAGVVHSVATFQNLRVFAVDVGAGFGAVLAEDPDVLEETGEIDSGTFDYGLGDEKLSLFVDMSHISHEGGSHEIWLATDREEFGLLATLTDSHDPVPTGEARGHEFELRIVLNRNASDTAMGPTIRSWTLRSQPAPPLTEILEYPFILAPVDERADGYEVAADAASKAEFIKNLCESKEVALLARGDQSWSVIVTDYQRDVIENYLGGDVPLGENTTCLTAMKVIS